ncbi:MmgE/PrpD family protein, partial [Pantoea dispersa]
MDTTLDRLADFIAATRFAQLPEPLVAQAKRHLLDTLGAALAGCDSPIWRECRALVAEEGGSAVAQL